jgi:hypothetical protein
MNRDTKVGELQRLKRERLRLAVEIDSTVKSILYHFDPMDDDLSYVRKLDPVKLEIWMNAIARKKQDYDKVAKRIEALAEELNESAD